MPSKQKNGLYRTKIKIGVDADGKDIVKWISGKTKAELEKAVNEFAEEAKADPQLLKTAPNNTPIRRLDDVKAVKEPKFTYKAL